MLQSNDNKEKSTDLFQRDPKEIDGLVLLTSQERDYIINTLLTWLFQIFLSRPTRDDTSSLIHILSNYLGAFYFAFVRLSISPSAFVPGENICDLLSFLGFS